MKEPPFVIVKHVARTRIVSDGTTKKVICIHPYEPGEPEGYVAWHEWAPRHAKGRGRQHQCRKCGIYLWRGQS